MEYRKIVVDDTEGKYDFIEMDDTKERPDFIEINDKRFHNGSGCYLSDNLWIKLDFESKNSANLYIEEKKQNSKDDISLSIRFFNDILKPELSRKSEIIMEFRNGNKSVFHLNLTQGIGRAHLETNGGYYEEIDEDYKSEWNRYGFIDLEQVGNAENYIQILINFLLEKKQIRQSLIMTECKGVIMQFISEVVPQMLNNEFLAQGTVTRLSSELQEEIDELKEKKSSLMEQIRYLENVQTKLNEESSVKRK